MDTASQLWLLKQIYKYENSHYDKETGISLHHIPAGITQDMLEGLDQAHHMPNQLFYPEHDEILQELSRLADAWTLPEAADAFVASLWSAPFLWRSALPGILLARVMPSHPHTPYGGSADTCVICGFQGRAVDATMSWYYRMNQGTPLDGEPVGYVLALREMAVLKERPIPTEYDLWTFRAILTMIRLAPPKTRYSKLRDMLHKERLLPTSNKYAYGSLLETMALIGLLDTEQCPGLFTRYTSYAKRDERPSVRTEVQGPLAMWDSSVGINDTTLKKLFPDLDTSSVDLTDRPQPVPPLSQTVTGDLEKRRLPRPKVVRSPDAGSGPVQAGDVYAVRIRDNVWITVYCHKIEGRYVYVEYLDGIFPEMPMKAQLKNTVRPRRDGRWQMRASGMDKTTGVRRVARNMPAPISDLPEPEKAPYGNAGELRHLASWCFAELY